MSVFAQEPAKKTLSSQQLEQLAAPIALYPDSLVAQILMASTYPLEVVEAARWRKDNDKLKGDALGSALKKQSWDASVKSLVNFPSVLTMMNERLSWTQQLGNAVLGQQQDIMAAVQRLRTKARAAGNLKTTAQQTVVVEEKVIRIEPASPEVIYVPAYNPMVVYGTWPYPAYPVPAPYYPPGYVAGAAIVGFAAGVAVSQAWGYAWGGCRWGGYGRGGSIDIDVDRNVNINNNISRERNANRQRNGGGQGGRGNWQHNPKHRRGVGYADRATGQRFNRSGNAQRQRSREQFRGRTSGANRTGAGRTGASRTGANRTGAGRTGASRAGSSHSWGSRSGGAFGGSRNGRTVRSNSSRGRASRSSGGMRRSHGGRSGGGRSRGGRRR